MNNPIAKVCRIIESCETEEQLIVARRVAQRAMKQHPSGAWLIWGTLQYAEGYFAAYHFKKLFTENPMIILDCETGEFTIDAIEATRKMIMVGPC